MAVGWRKWLRCGLIILLMEAALLFCTSSDRVVAEQITIGTSDGPQGEIMEYVSSLAEQEGIRVKLVMTNDYVWLDEALDDGEIDLNAAQNQLFLNRQRQDRGYDFSVLCRTVLQPMGIYSQQLTSLPELPYAAKVSLPQDPLNCSRALQLLADSGLITVKDNADGLISLSDIVDNPRQLSFQLMEAEMAARSLPAVDIAVINAGFADLAGLTTDKALYLERPDSAYAGMIVCRSSDRNRPAVEKLCQLYQSAAVKQFIEERFKGMIIAVW